MNVLESRTGRPLWLQPWVLLVGGAAVDRGGPRPHPRFVVTEAFRFRRRCPARATPSPARGRVARRRPASTEGHEPGSWRAERRAEHDHLPHVLEASVAAPGGAGAHSRHRRQAGCRPTPPRCPTPLASPLIPSSQVVVTIPGGGARPAVRGRRHAAQLALRRLLLLPPATRSGCSSSWRS